MNTTRQELFNGASPVFKMRALDFPAPPSIAALAETLQSESFYSHIYPIDETIYRSPERLLAVAEQGSLGDLRQYQRNFMEHGALLVGWEKELAPEALVIAVKARSGPGEDLRPIWGGSQPLGPLLGMLQTIPHIQKPGEGGVDSDRFRILLLDHKEFDDLRDLVDHPAKRTQVLATTPSTSTAPVPELFMRVIARAARDGASDVHIYPTAKGFQIAYRIDGELIEDRQPLPLSVANSLVSHVKSRANLRIDERRYPQSGKLEFDQSEDNLKHRINGLALRVESVPCESAFSGTQTEALGIRLQSHITSDRYDLKRLGYTPNQLAMIRSVLNAPDGLILVAGPTGAGKTTTLYACLQYLNDGRNRIYTVEDPVESRFERVTQIQTSAGKELTFAAVLRSLLRMDPDVIMIGEIRDDETAQTAIKAVTTGHQVLSTLHAPNAVAIATRLRETNVAPSQLAAAFSMGIAQRLVRVFDMDITNSIEQYDGRDELNALLKEDLIKDPVALWRPRMGTGAKAFKGRTCVSEIWVPREKTRSALSEKATELELRDNALKNDGLEPLLFHGLRLALTGETSLAELKRTVVADSEFHEMPQMVLDLVKAYGKKPGA